MGTKKRGYRIKGGFHALKEGGIDGVKRIARSYEELAQYFDPNVRMPVRRVFDTYDEAYDWLYDITPPPAYAPPLF